MENEIDYCDQEEIDKNFADERELPDCDNCIENHCYLCPYENDGRSNKGNCK
jgi:hypothetical protein